MLYFSKINHYRERLMFQGSMVALITPFTNNGEIDYPAFERLLTYHIDAKTDAIVVAGTTGEAATLTSEEKIGLFKHALAFVKGKTLIIAGTAMSSTKACIEFNKKVKAIGVDGVLIMTPAYIKPTQHGLFEHYKAIATRVDIPIILYNVPGRTAVDLQPDTIAKLTALENIKAVKEASGKLERVQEIIEKTDGKISVLSGEDALTIAMMEKGAKGCISVTANIAPKMLKHACDAALNGDIDKAKAIDDKLSALHHALFIESNPIPVKWLLANYLNFANVLRLPLTPLLNVNEAQLIPFLNQLKEVTLC